MQRSIEEMRSRHAGRGLTPDCMAEMAANMEERERTKKNGGGTLN